MKIDKNNVIFLLGGHDLEMITIRDLLDENNISYFDESQKWGAKLSDYKKRLEENPEKEIYAVELIEDIDLPNNYNRIDHHNDFVDKEASILQILKLLSIEANREYLLIAANDVDHIEGMKCISATDDEIKDIRKKDRELQGVTKKEELLAKEEIKTIQQDGNMSIIQSSLSTFTPIVDFCDKRPLLVYSDDTLMFYGDISPLKEQYAEQIKSKEVFYGKNYFGFDKKYLDFKDIEINVGEIIKLTRHEHNEIYSYHTFMLPFRFDKIVNTFDNTYDYYQSETISDRISITSHMQDLLKKDGWDHKPFEIHDNFDYNEYAYFYSNIRDTLYNKDSFLENNTSYFFEKAYVGGKFCIKIKDCNYELELEGLSLRIFETGIAIFSIEVSNRKFSQSKIDDILKINEYGRRIYAPFLGRWEDDVNWSQAPKDSQLAESIKVTLPNGTVCEDTFCTEYINIPNDIKISTYILQLLGVNTFTTQKNDKNQYFMQPVIDDRMFVLSWYGDDVCSESLKNDNYKDNDKWYEYVFVDGDGITVHNKKMQEALILNSTYDRWMNHKEGTTLFGLSRYSFVCLSNASYFSKNVLPLPHMKTMYFQMFTLLLSIRASTLRFSEEVTAISNIQDTEENNFSNKVSELYKYYIKFVNKIYFREITAQEQGIELYNKASELMKIERDVKDLDAEIAELYTYVSMNAEKKQAEEANKRERRLETISKLGAVFLPPSLVAGIFGMNVFNFSQSYGSMFIVLLLMILSAVVSYWLILENKKNDSVKKDNSEKDNKKDLIKMTSIGFVLMFCIGLFVFFIGEKRCIAQDVNVMNPVMIKSCTRHDDPRLSIQEENAK